MSAPASSGRPSFAALADRPRCRVLVVGGGINGIGIFRELARQGIDAILVERGDFASGASAASSHMIHGGIRYLENGEFRLVRESVRERNRLLRVAAHLVSPQPTTVPIRRTFSGLLAAPLRFLRHRAGRPVERGALLIKVGLVIYDLFSRDGGSVPRHRFLGRRRSLAELPDLDPGVKYTATYFDAVVRHPERLAMDVLLDALAANPDARAANYVAAVGAAPGGVRLRDELTGEELVVECEVVVNACGPWTDLTNEALGMPTAYLGGTKGSHIVLDHPELLAATRGRELFFEYADGRIVLILPLNGRVLVGTTDVDADPREPIVCTEEEVDYFLDIVSTVLPGIAVDRSSIVYRYAGIRPLPRHGDLAPGFVSRDYRLEHAHADAGWQLLSLVGGKWTTFLALAETVGARVLDLLGAPGRRLDRDRPIGGAAGYPPSESARAEWLATRLAEVSPARAAVLFDRYGTRAGDVVRAGQDDDELANGLLSRGELGYLVATEHVARLSDVVLRRTDLAFTGRADRPVLDELARELGELLGWDADRRRAEADECAAALGSGEPAHG